MVTFCTFTDSLRESDRGSPPVNLSDMGSDKPEWVLSAAQKLNTLYRDQEHKQNAFLKQIQSLSGDSQAYVQFAASVLSKRSHYAPPMHIASLVKPMCNPIAPAPTPVPVSLSTPSAPLRPCNLNSPNPRSPLSPFHRAGAGTSAAVEKMRMASPSPPVLSRVPLDNSVPSKRAVLGHMTAQAQVDPVSVFGPFDPARIDFRALCGISVPSRRSQSADWTTDRFTPAEAEWERTAQLRLARQHTAYSRNMARSAPSRPTPRS